MTQFLVAPERSTLIVEARSSVGPIYWRASALAGGFDVTVTDGEVDLSRPPSGWLDVQVASLTSGNDLYDAELARRIDARGHPQARIELVGASRVGTSNRFHLEGELTLHGVTRHIAGTAGAQLVGDDHVRVSGEQAIDIRDFEIPVPTILMLRIFPDVRIRMVLESDRRH